MKTVKNTHELGDLILENFHIAGLIIRLKIVDSYSRVFIKFSQRVVSTACSFLKQSTNMEKFWAIYLAGAYLAFILNLIMYRRVTKGANDISVFRFIADMLIILFFCIFSWFCVILHFVYVKRI